MSSTVDAIPRPPLLTRDRAEALAREWFGVAGAAEALPSERDANFLIRAVGGAEYVLKCSGATEERSSLEAQNEALRLVSEAGATACPVVVPTLNGAPITPIALDEETHFLRLVTYVPGRRLVDIRPHDRALLMDVGALLGRVDKALVPLKHPGARHQLFWDLKHAHGRVQDLSPGLGGTVALRVREFSRLFAETVLPVLPQLRQSVIHNDGNDYNLLCTPRSASLPATVRSGWDASGIIDFGDLVETCTVFEPAVAAAYAALGKDAPLDAIAAVVAGYHREYPLTEMELRVLFPAVAMRLAFSVALATTRIRRGQVKEYLFVTLEPARHTLELLRAIPPALAEATLRAVCGFAPSRATAPVTAWIASHTSDFHPLLPVPLTSGDEVGFLDLGPGSSDLAGVHNLDDLRELQTALADRLHAKPVWIGRYAEPRPFYAGEAFRGKGALVDSYRTIHLGVDLFTAPGVPIAAPLDGRVRSITDNAGEGDYGPTILLEHTVDGKRLPSNGASLEPRISFFTLYGHLDPECLTRWQPGDAVKKGAELARIGAPPQNGNWPPHLHFQLITDTLGLGDNFPGVCAWADRGLWMGVSPDPSPLLGIDAAHTSERGITKLRERRAEHVGPSLSLSYAEPLHMVRGSGATLIDDLGRPFLDTVNNVCHVGHCHPDVVEAGQRQMALLNTNTRYLHENLALYAERLVALFPAPLEVCYFVCSGSEANELALRLARAHTGRQDALVVDSAYHGNTNALIDLSPYKHDGRGGSGSPSYVHVLALPDTYRGKYRGPDAGSEYVAEARAVVENTRAAQHPIGAFFCETIFGCGGQIVPPDGYLDGVYAAVRASGGVCIADEVQVGFGRVGTHDWAFQTQGVVPDIVTLGKPMGNGHPLGAVVTTRAIADSFNNGMEYFNTFGGNPVSAALGLAVLEVIEKEGLRERALSVGGHFRSELERLQARYPLIGDVRGLGLFLGVELSLDRSSRVPAATEAEYVVEQMKARGILSSTDGPAHNVLKIKPPLVFSRADADRFVETLDAVLGHTFLSR